MEEDAQQAREMKVLSDILALVLDEQPGVSSSAFDAVRQRARQGGVTGGALKEAFRQARSVSDGRFEAQAAATAAASRARIEALQSQVGAVEQMMRQDRMRLQGVVRRARLLAAMTGLIAGAALAVLADALLQAGGLS